MATINGTAHADTLTGGSGDDTIGAGTEKCVVVRFCLKPPGRLVIAPLGIATREATRQVSATSLGRAITRLRWQ